MSSSPTTSTTNAAVAGTTTTVSCCHVCNTSISATTSSLLCPHCHSNQNPNPNLNPSQLEFPSFLDPSISTTTSDFPFPSVTSSDDNFLLDSPYLHRLIHHLTSSNDSSPSTTSHHHSPASKSAIESIPMVKITSALLDIDPVVICAVCKDQFVVDDETKQLPCKHMYHPDCILPWLSQHNSCPVCRFRLPTESGATCELRVRRRSRSRILRLGDLMEDVDDEEALGFELRQLTRRHRVFFPVSEHSLRRPEMEAEGLSSGSRIGESDEVDVAPNSGVGSRVESASSWPEWEVDVGGVDGGDASWGDVPDFAMP